VKTGKKSPNIRLKYKKVFIEIQKKGAWRQNIKNRGKAFTFTSIKKQESFIN